MSPRFSLVNPKIEHLHNCQATCKAQYATESQSGLSRKIGSGNLGIDNLFCTVSKCGTANKVQAVRVGGQVASCAYSVRLRLHMQLWHLYIVT